MTQKTALFEKHEKLGAKMVPFGGFSMPIQYSSVKEEALAVRENVGIFDVGHMGEFWVEGEEASAFIDTLLTNRFKNVEEGKAVYSPMCREDGTVIDDLISYKITQDQILLCVNASNIEKDWKWIEAQSKNYKVNLKDASSETSLVAVQGPQAVKVMESLGLLDSGEEFPSFSFKKKNYEGENIIMSRTGYTGEDGFEIYLSNSIAPTLWDALIEKNVTPCGLAARDVLRMEACLPLYGHEIHDEVTPLDSALKWTVKMDKDHFIGKKALSEYEPRFKLVKLSLEKGIPREGYEVLDSEGNPIGKVVSGTMSVTLGKGIAIAHVSHLPENREFQIQIRKRTYPANYHKKAFYRRT